MQNLASNARGIHQIQKGNYEPQAKNPDNKWKKIAFNKPSKTGQLTLAQGYNLSMNGF